MENIHHRFAGGLRPPDPPPGGLRPPDPPPHVYRKGSIKHTPLTCKWRTFITVSQGGDTAAMAALMSWHSYRVRIHLVLHAVFDEVRSVVVYMDSYATGFGDQAHTRLCICVSTIIHPLPFPSPSPFSPSPFSRSTDLNGRIS